MQIKARGKINWTLDVLYKRPDGYHALDMVLQSVELYDTLRILPADALSFALEGYARVPNDEDNLALRAANLLRTEYDVRMGAEIRLTKRIPVGAGMGGGSADAAAALMGLNRLWGLCLSEEELCRLAVQIGADVPYCLTGGLQRVRGMGEQLERLPCAMPYWLVVIQPCKGLATRDVFGNLKIEEISPQRRPHNDAAQEALAEADLRGITRAMGNVLQAAAMELRPEICFAVQALEHFGAIRAQMTGSGSAVFGVFESARAAQKAWEQAAKLWRRCWTTRTASRSLVFREAMR